ncbi:class I SAM-dependent methyltransferase [Rhodovibrionaceae bacterium A322]
MSAIYDTIGINYADLRRPDARIAARIGAALGSAETVLNVGAGAGSYEPRDRQVTALEPSAKMIAQRPAGAAPCVQGFAEDLPFEGGAFDAVMAVLTVHHWSDQARGLRELRRVARGPVVILTFDPDFQGFWLADYLPELISLDDANMPSLNAYAPHLGPVEITTVPVPHDCSDGFLGGYWRRPAAYLDARVRSAISCFWSMNRLEEGLARLAQDLESGGWERKYGELLTREDLDLGYRLVVARG